MNKPCGEIKLGEAALTNLNPGFRTEWPRIRFLIERDGLNAALIWCENTMKIYRAAVLDRGNANRKGHYASTREFKRTFIDSYKDFKQLLAMYGEDK